MRMAGVRAALPEGLAALTMQLAHSDGLHQGWAVPARGQDILRIACLNPVVVQQRPTALENPRSEFNTQPDPSSLYKHELAILIRLARARGRALAAACSCPAQLLQRGVVGQDPSLMGEMSCSERRSDEFPGSRTSPTTADVSFRAACGLSISPHVHRASALLLSNEEATLCLRTCQLLQHDPSGPFNSITLMWCRRGVKSATDLSSGPI